MAPFKDWVVPASIEEVQGRLARTHDGDRQMDATAVKIPTATHERPLRKFNYRRRAQVGTTRQVCLEPSPQQCGASVGEPRLKKSNKGHERFSDRAPHGQMAECYPPISSERVG